MRSHTPLGADAANMALPLSIPDWWTPAIRAWSPANTNPHKTCVDLSVEWQAFVGRRLNEDFGLLQQISSAKGPDDIWNACSRFWQKAAEDYATECLVMARLTTGLLAHNVAAGQSASAKDTHIARPQAKAA
jgi:hypothetical protein